LPHLAFTFTFLLPLQMQHYYTAVTIFRFFYEQPGVPQ